MAVIEPKNARLRIERFEYRIVFSKKGRMIYISHLDMKRAIQRIIKKSKLPVWYTQGFNPQIYLNIPLALSLGLESDCEVMDIMLTEELPFDEVRDRLNAGFPEGLEALEVYTPVHKHTEIASSCYEVRLKTERSAEESKKLFEDFLARDTIEIEKRTKKKTTKLVDIKPHITMLGLSGDDGAMKIEIKLPAGNEFNLNLNVVLDAYLEWSGQTMDEFYAKRTKLLMTDGENFT